MASDSTLKRHGGRAQADMPISKTSKPPIVMAEVLKTCGHTLTKEGA